MAGGADADVFKTNKFLARFAQKVQGDDEEGAVTGQGGEPGKPRSGKALWAKAAQATAPVAFQSRGKALWNKAKGLKLIKKTQISAEEAQRIRRSKLVPFSKRYILVRWTIGWIFNVVIFVLLWLINFIYGVQFGPMAFQNVLLGWAAGLIQTFCIVEPAEVLALVLIPNVANNGFIAKCKANCKELGFI